MTEELITEEASLARPSGSNAPSFYFRCLAESKKADLLLAQQLTGLEAEITLMRLHVQDLVNAPSPNPKTIQAALLVLEKLVRTQSKLSGADSSRMAEAVARILNGVRLPDGTRASLKK